MRGYHHLPEATAEAFVDGWFATGDIGELDDHGYLKITDRKKDLIKTSGGKYVAPSEVEGVIKAACPYVSQVVAHGEGRKYISALIALDPEAIAEWADAQGLTYASPEDLTKSRISGRQSTACCLSFSPYQYMLVSGATPSWAISLRIDRLARTSMTAPVFLDATNS